MLHKRHFDALVCLQHRIVELEEDWASMQRDSSILITAVEEALKTVNDFRVRQFCLQRKIMALVGNNQDNAQLFSFLLVSFGVQALKRRSNLNPSTSFIGMQRLYSKSLPNIL